MGFMYDYMTKFFGPYSKREQGAIYWKVDGQLFENSVNEVFISDGSTTWVFVGATFSVPPEVIAEGAKRTYGASFWKKNPSHKYTAFKSASSSEIVWKDSGSKALCQHDLGVFPKP